MPKSRSAPVPSATSTRTVPVSGHIAAVSDRGLPEELLIPCLPFDARPFNADVKSLGKAPARRMVQGDWVGLSDWCKIGALPPEQRTIADEAGANCGIILGTVFGDLQFIFLDLDTEPGNELGSESWNLAHDITGVALSQLQTALDVPGIWVRKTRPGRAGVLLRMPASADPGRKGVLKMSMDGIGRGKIELLSRGQQAANAGTHVFGNGTPIRWYRTDKPDEVHRAPAIDDAMPTIANREVLDAAIDAAVVVLGLIYGIQFSAKSLKSASADDAPPTDLTMMPPTVGMLVGLLDRMPHDGAVVDRDSWIQISRSVSGCCAAMQAAQRLSDDDASRIEQAVVGWMARWTGGIYTEQAASTKWRDDILQHPNTETPCWSFLVGKAIALGDSSMHAESLRLRADEISGEFTEDLEDVPPETAHVSELAPEPPVRPTLLIQHGDLVGTARSLVPLLATHPTLFEQDGKPVKVADKDGTPAIGALGSYGVIVAAHDVCSTVARAARGGGISPATMPKSVADFYLAMNGERRLRPLHGVAMAPLLSADGMIADRLGYDGISKLWCHSIPALSVSERPTKAQAAVALLTLRHVFRGFCYADAEQVLDPDWGLPVTDISRPPGVAESAVMNALLTAVCRPSLPLAPGLVVSAPAGGSGSASGKGLLVRAIASIAFGITPGAVTTGGDGVEFEKRVWTALRKGQPVLLLDNVNATSLSSDALASATTEALSEPRILGKSEDVTVRPNTFVTITGNGVSVCEDLVRRFLEAQLDPKMEDASSRDFPPDFLEDVLARRAELLSAALTIWRWGVQNPQDLKKGGTLGSFERWGAWVRDPLLTLGCRDPVDAIRKARAEDPRRMEVLELLEAWHDTRGGTPLTAAAVREDFRLIPLLRAKTDSRQAVTTRLNQIANGRVAGYRLVRIESDGDAPATYAVEKIKTPEAVDLVDKI